jgi:hypothetical protein
MYTYIYEFVSALLGFVSCWGLCVWFHYRTVCVCVCPCIYIYIYIIPGMKVKEEDLHAIFEASGGTDLSLMNTISSIDKTLNGHESIMLHQAKGLKSQTYSIQ